ncbi:MAG: ABC transporter permease [Actinomycetota bacterium]|nr:ABC transporter permease [Actinomycetota bacterium]
MLRATFRSLLARKLRLLLAAVAIVLGVSFVSGALVLTDTLGKTFDTLFSTVNQNVAVAVRGTHTFSGGDQGTNGADAPREVVPAAALEAVRKVDGVVEAQGSVFGSAALVGRNGKPIGGSGPPQFGLNWIDSPRLNSAHLVDGRAPRGPDEIAISKFMATSGKYAVGDRAPVLSAQPTRAYRIVGVFAYPGGKSSLGGETTIAFDLPTARAVLGIPAGYTEIDAAAASGVSADTLRGRVTRVLPAHTEAITGKKLADEQAAGIRTFIGYINTFLLVFAAVALFVGAFIIFNTFTMLVAQRTRELALLRALGASRRQVTRSVLVEAVAVGTLASALGLGLGVLVALGLKGVFKLIGADLPSGPIVFAPRTVVVAFAVGIIVTALAALFPARRASSVSPMAALRDAATPDRPLRRQSIIGAVVLALGAGAVGWGLSGAGLSVLGVGTLLAFVGVAMLSPVISRPVAGLLGRPFQRQLPGRLGRVNTLRNPRRTASTAAALMIGLALVSAVSILGASLKASVQKIADSAIGADFILNTQSENGFSASVLDSLQQQPGVAEVSGLRFSPAQVGSGTAGVMAVSPSAVGHLIKLDRRSGSMRLDPQTVLITEKVAKKDHLKPGQTLHVLFPKGAPRDFRIGGVYADSQLVNAYLFDDAVTKDFATQSLAAALVKLSPGADTAAARRSLDAIAKPYPNIIVQDQSEFVQAATGQIDQVVNVLYLLLALSVLIAVLGIINTLALSVIERTRELGLLRAIGMSRRQVKRMIRVEAVVIAVFGGLLGLLVGSAFGVAIQRDLVSQGVTELQFPVVRMLVFVVLAALAGVLAAWLPARRGSRLNVLAAIAAE